MCTVRRGAALPSIVGEVVLPRDRGKAGIWINERQSISHKHRTWPNTGFGQRRAGTSGQQRLFWSEEVCALPLSITRKKSTSSERQGGVGRILPYFSRKIPIEQQQIPVARPEPSYPYPFSPTD